jgi:hypothetical protein
VGYTLARRRYAARPQRQNRGWIVPGEIGLS